MYDKMLTPQEYLEMMTGKYYHLEEYNQLEEVEKILDEQFGEGAYWGFALDNIDEVMENDHKVVLVEIVNVITKNDEAEQIKLYRWFEIPDDWTKGGYADKSVKNKYKMNYVCYFFAKKSFSRTYTLNLYSSIM